MQNGQVRVDPLRGFVIEEKRFTRRDELRLYRAAIERAMDLEDVPRAGGHRHWRAPLSTHEQNHHEKVDRFLERIKTNVIRSDS